MLLSLLLSIPTVAQTNTSTDYRQAVGNGPFPVYFGLGFIHNSNQPAFERLVNPMSAHFDGVDGRIRMYGYEFAIGAIHNTESFLWIPRFRVHSMSTEASYKYLDRDYDDDDDRRILLRQHVFAARIGFRHVIYYPITLHWQLGLVLMHSTQLRVTGDTDVNTSINGYASTRLLDIAGIEARGRIVFFDPVGAAGGFSLFVEGQLVISTNPPDMAPLAKAIGLDGYDQGSLTTGIFSIGTTIPLALRLR